MKERLQLSYGTPSAHGRIFSRGLCIFIATCALVMIWYGIWYIRTWYWARQQRMFGIVGYEPDLPLGVAACATGLTLFILSAWLFRRAGATRHGN
jgi:hypothetical protein